MKRAAGWWLCVAVWSCGTPAPKDIRYAEELCDYCHMTIVNPAFAGQVVTRTGRVYVFDDLAGLASFVRDERLRPAEVYGLWANLYLDPDRRIEVQQAVFLRSEHLHTPMSSGLAAFDSQASADSMRASIGGEVLDWTEVLGLQAHRADSGSIEPMVGL